MVHPLLKRQKSTINIFRCSDSIPTQAHPFPKAGEDHSITQPKAGGNDHVAHHQKATFEVATWFMKAIVFTKTSWPIISDEKYLMVDKAWQLAVEAQDRQQVLAGAPVGTPSGCQLPSGPSLQINLHT